MAIHLIALSALILAVLLVRAAFRKKVPARLIYALWLVVAVKLCMPFSLFAVELPSAAEVPQEVSQTEQTVVQTQDIPATTKATQTTVSAPVIPVAPITPVAPTVPQQPIASQQTVTQPSEPIVPTVTEPAVIEPIETEVAIPEVPTVEEKVPIDWAHVAKVVWLVGSAVMAVWFAVTGTVFHQKLRTDRRLHTTVGKTKVYVSKSAGAPCLAGIVPAIYLTPDAANSPSEHFVITHEHTHLRHGDHIWSALRTAALIVYWWNPLVWAAAMVSKQDAELACDEAVAAKLDDSQRLAYAHTILDTIPQKHAHAVGLGSAPIKERILMLTKQHKNRVVAAILAVALTLSAIGCSFIGPRETTEPVEGTDLPDSITTAEQSDPPTATTDSSIENLPTEQQEPVRVLSNDGNLHIHTVMLPLENEDMQFYDLSRTKHSTRYRMFLEYDNSAGKQYQYRKLYVVDALNGEIADCLDLDIRAGLPRITYTDNGGVIYAPITDPVTGTLSSYYMLTVTEKNGEFSLQKNEMQADASLVTSRFASPDGRCVAYQTEETSGDHGGIYLQSSDGSSQCICENKTAADVASEEVRFYSLTGFADDKHLVYSIHGDLQKVSGIGNGQLPIGYGIYNTETGERTEVHNGKVPIGICDGTLYLGVYSDMVPQEIWRAGIDGEEELIASRNAADGVFAMSEDRLFSWDHSMWHRYFPAENAAANTTQVEFYSPDFDQKLAEVSYWKTDTILSNTMVRFLICEDSVTFVVPYVKEETAQSTVKVLSNAGNLDIHAVLLPLTSEDMRYLCFSYTDRYKIYLTYTYASGNAREHTGNYLYYDSLYIVDAAKGEIVYTDTIDDVVPSYASLADSGNGFVLYTTGGYTYAVQEHDGEFVRCTVDFRGYPLAEQHFVSADGTYTAYKIIEDALGHGGIDVQSSDGTTKRILENIVFDNTMDGEILGFEQPWYYDPIGFIDDVHIAYTIGGWESMAGYGIYNVVTDEKTEVYGIYRAVGVHGGVLYVEERLRVDDGVCAIWQVTPDGARTKIAPSDGNASLAIIAETGYPTFEHSMWYTIETEDVCKVTLYSPDFDSQKLAEIECPYATQYFMKQCLLIYQNSVAVVVPYVSAQEDVYAETSTVDTEFYTSVEADEATYYTDLTGDGVAEICTVKVSTRGANSYIEDITVTDGQNGETIAVVDPQVFTDHNSLLHVGGDADTVVCREVDYTVRDGVLMCCMRRSGIVGDDTKSWTLSYTYSYAAGELVITSARLRDDMTREVTDFDTLEPSAAEITVDVANFAASMEELFESTDASLQHPYTLHITGLPVPVSFDMESEVRPASMHAYGQTVVMDAGVRFYGNCSSELFAYDGCIILTWDYYGIGCTYVIGENFTAVMEPGVNDSAVLRLSDSGELIYERVNNRMPLIQQTCGAGGVTGYDMFLQSAGPAAIQNGEIILGEPDEYYTVSDKYDLDQVFQKNFAHRLASIEDMFAENRKRYETEESTTITSLADWNQLNYDGQFSDAGNCYALINGLVHFGGGADLSERYPEFQTVTIGEYAISRKKDEKFLYFDFTVTASGLDTLPVGNYKTTVASFAGPQSDDAEMEILECDAKGRPQSVTTDRASNRYLSTWFLAELAWDMGDYGTYDTSASDGFPYNYLAHCETGRYSLAELNALVKDAFGVEIAADSWFTEHYTDDNGDIVLTPGVGGFAFFYDIVDLQIGEDADLITVQHYTDINKLIKSVKVAYRVSNTGRVYGCELIEDAKYAPFGALYARYKYKGWEPMQ